MEKRYSFIGHDGQINDVVPGGGITVGPVEIETSPGVFGPADLSLLVTIPEPMDQERDADKYMRSQGYVPAA